MREAVREAPCFRRSPFTSVYSVEDHKKHIDWIKEINPRALVSREGLHADDVDMVAVGSYYAGAHIIHLDGSYGGTGAAPDIAKKNIAMPIEYAITKVHKFLKDEGMRDCDDAYRLRRHPDAPTTWPRPSALGADGVCSAPQTGGPGMRPLPPLRIGPRLRPGHRHDGRGAGRPMNVEWATQRIINLYLALATSSSSTSCSGWA